MAFVISAVWRAREGEVERIEGIIERIGEASRREPGNLLWQAHRSPDDARLFWIYEQYADESAARAHSESEHFRRLVLEEAVPLLESRERSYFETYPPDG
jgi:quinol monooxygenase YgiN